jgi:predicted MPP superfamily phosphohydrolase
VGRADDHFHGTPSRAYYDALFADLRALPKPDLVLLVGDYLDSDAHHPWIGELLSPLEATCGRFALLGNHDIDHAPDRVRQELEYAGYAVVGQRPARAVIRGVECAVVGHEGPWFPPPTGVDELPPDLVKIGLSHSPDNIGWARRHNVPLLFCGHVHGGQIRLPVIGPIFVPSMYSRRYDGGVYQSGPTTLVVGRGLSGKEPLRFRCLPQVLRVTLRC